MCCEAVKEMVTESMRSSIDPDPTYAGDQEETGSDSILSVPLEVSWVA